MYNLEINIGLNVGNVEPSGQMSKSLFHVREHIILEQSNIRVDVGSWETEEGVIEERVIIARMNVGDMSRYAIHNILSKIAYKLNQDAIAYFLRGVGDIAYNKEYKGEKYDYKDEYFKHF